MNIVAVCLCLYTYVHSLCKYNVTSALCNENDCLPSSTLSSQVVTCPCSSCICVLHVCAMSPVRQHDMYDCLSSCIVSSRCVTCPFSSCPHTRAHHVVSLKKMSSFRRAFALKILFINMKKILGRGGGAAKPRRKILHVSMTSGCS